MVFPDPPIRVPEDRREVWKMIKNAAKTGILFVALAALVGCAATERVIDYSSMKTDVKMSKSIFLEPLAKSPKKVYVEVKNTTNRPELVSNFQPVLISQLQAKGYQITQNPKEADYWIQCNIRYIGLYNDKIIKDGVVTGAAVGALSGLAIARSAAGVAGGALVGGVLGLGADVATRTKTQVIAVDLRVTERANSKPKVHEAGVAASATKIWLTTEAAAPVLVQMAAEQISGIF
jgi:hypothetical protein